MRMALRRTDGPRGFDSTFWRKVDLMWVIPLLVVSLSVWPLALVSIAIAGIVATKANKGVRRHQLLLALSVYLTSLVLGFVLWLLFVGPANLVLLPTMLLRI